MKHSFALAIVLAVASLGIVAGCGGEDGSSREELSERLQSIDQQGGERWSLLAQRAEDLKPGQLIPAEVKQPISELLDFQRQAVAELEELNPPEEAEEEVETLIEALRDRTEIFEQALEAGRFTRRDSDQITASGDKIDEAFEQLRKEGLLPEDDEHKEE